MPFVYVFQTKKNEKKTGKTQCLALTNTEEQRRSINYVYV